MAMSTLLVWLLCCSVTFHQEQTTAEHRLAVWQHLAAAQNSPNCLLSSGFSEVVTTAHDFELQHDS